MKEETLAKIAVVLSATGIVTILLLEAAFSPEETEIAKISETSVGKSIKIKGIVEWKQQKQGITLFQINDGTKIFCYFIGQKELSEKIRPGLYVVVEGRVEKNGEELEIIARKVAEWKA